VSHGSMRTHGEVVECLGMGRWVLVIVFVLVPYPALSVVRQGCTYVRGSTYRRPEVSRKGGLRMAPMPLTYDYSYCVVLGVS
jgi:hypothetical protein